MEKLKSLPKEKKLRLLIAAGAAVAAILIIVLIFTVIIPAATPKIDVSKYIAVNFDSETQYKGNVSGKIKLDRDAFMADYKNGNTDELVLTGAADRLLDLACYKYLSAENSEKQEAKAVPDGEFKGELPFDGAYGDEIYKIELSWPEDNDAQQQISREEKTCGIVIDKTPKTFTVKLADYIAQEKIELKQAVELNILDYIRDNDLLITLPKEKSDDSPEGKMQLGFDLFETKIGDYTITNRGIYDKSVLIYDKNGKYNSVVYFNFPAEADFSEGDEFKLSYDDKTSGQKGGFLFTGDPVEYTVEKSELLSADSAKANLNGVKEYFARNLVSLDKDADKNNEIEVNSAYFTVNKLDPSFNRLVLIYTNKSKNYSKALEFNRDGFFSGGRFVFYGFNELGEKAKTSDEAAKACACIDSKNTDYQITKIG